MSIKDELVKWANEAPNKTALTDVAKKYFGLDLVAGKMKRNDIVESIIAAFDEKEKELPELDFLPKAEIVNPEPEVAHGSIFSIIPEGHEPKQTPTFNHGAFKYMLVSYVISDLLDDIRYTKQLPDLSNLPASTLKTLIAALWHIKKYGYIMVRETRNNNFKHYKLEEFE